MRQIVRVDYLFMSPTRTLYGAVCCHDICGIYQYKMNRVYNDQWPVIAMRVFELQGEPVSFSSVL
jgi:hypothetical protein